MLDGNLMYMGVYWYNFSLNYNRLAWFRLKQRVDKLCLNS